MAVLAGCKNQAEGIAPSTPAPPVLDNPSNPSLTDQSVMKHGETQTVNSWEITLDTSDSVENIELANGWTVEVVYE